MKIKQLTFLLAFLFLAQITNAQTKISVPASAKEGPTYVGSDGILRGANMTMSNARLLDAKSSSLKIVYIADKGKEGTFFVDDADTTSPDDSAMVIKTANNKRLKRNYSGYIEVKFFGAKGDSITDDTQAIRKAIAYCTREKKTLFFPKTAKKYRISSQINLTCSIESEKAEIVQTGIDQNVFVIQNQADISIRRLKIDVNAQHSGGLVYDKHTGIMVLNSSRIKIYDVEVQRYWGAAINLKNCWDSDIEQCLFINSRSTADLFGDQLLSNSDYDIYCGSDTKGGRNRILNNRCYSHKTSGGGIWVNFGGKDTETLVQGNKCGAMLPSMTLAPVSQVLKRHGIQVGYFDTSDTSHTIVSNNYCFNTNTTGISIAAKGENQAVSVIANVCHRNGLSNINAYLSGGITVQVCGKGTFADNVITDFQGTDNLNGAFSVTGHYLNTVKWDVTISNTKIYNSKANGVLVLGKPENVTFLNTEIKNSTRSDVFWTDTNPGIKNISFINTKIERNNNNFISMYFLNVDDPKGLSIIGGKIKGVSNTLTGSNIGVYFSRVHVNADTTSSYGPIVVKDVEIEDFGRGIAVEAPVYGSVESKFIVENITFRNVTNAFNVRADNANGFAPILNSKFFGVTNRVDGWGYLNPCFALSRVGTSLQGAANSAPGNGKWKIGDIIWSSSGANAGWRWNGSAWVSF